MLYSRWEAVSARNVMASIVVLVVGWEVVAEEVDGAFQMEGRLTSGANS